MSTWPISSIPNSRFGILLSLTASWTWAFGTLYTKQQAAAFNPYFSLGLQMLISGILTTIIAVSAGQTIPMQDIPRQSWTAIAYLATFGSVISFIAYLYALQNLPTEQASIYAYINPVVAVLLGSLLFNEKLTLFIIAGGAITLLGVHLINQAISKEEKLIRISIPVHRLFHEQLKHLTPAGKGLIRPRIELCQIEIIIPFILRTCSWYNISSA